MKAEAANELGDGGTAAAMVELIRARAEVVTIQFYLHSLRKPGSNEAGYQR
jgi:hypothetical protein